MAAKDFSKEVSDGVMGLIKAVKSGREYGIPESAIYADLLAITEGRSVTPTEKIEVATASPTVTGVRVTEFKR